MSVKRQATTELNHDNWDQEDSTEPEDTEGFKMAAKEVLEKRVIRTAKRRSNISNSDGQKSVFSGFGGFNKAQKTSFDFLANLTNGNKANTSSLSTPNTQGGLFASKPFSSESSIGFAGLGTSTPNPSKTTSTNQTPLFGKAVTTSTELNFPSTETKPDAKVSQNESPFKIQTSSTTASTFSLSATKTSSPSATLQTTSSPFIGPSSGLFSKSSPFKMSSASSKNSMSPTKPDNTLEKKGSNDKKEFGGDKEEIDEKKLKYYKNIQGLNVSVSDWIKKHVEETPLCILTPIFKDYEKHLKEIQDEYFNSKESKPNGEKGDFKQNLTTHDPKAQSASFTGMSVFSNSSTPPQNKSVNTPEKTNIFGSSPSNKPENAGKVGFTFGNISKSPTLSSNPDQTSKVNSGFSFGSVSKAQSSDTSSNSDQTLKASSGFSFGSNSTTTSSSGMSSIPTTKTGFSFGMTPTSKASGSTDASATSTNGTSTFSFGVGKPFSFNSNIQKKEEESTQNNTNEDEDEPPKVEFTPLVEENSVFDKKCKIFFKKDGTFVDKGVSTLYIKKIEESGKHQLLVRANTSLGNVLLNMVLSSSIPTQRMGKNNVMLVCIPTPDAKPPPVPVLIRVKTSEEADDLLDVLNKYKM